VVGKEQPLPDASDIGAALAEAAEEELARQEALQQPAEVQERKASRWAYAGLDSRLEAAELLRSTFAEALAALNQDPGRFLSDAQLDQRLGTTTARVTADGQPSLLEAGTPVEARDEEGDLRKVDLDLEEVEGGYAPANPLVQLEIPKKPNNGIALETDAGELLITPISAGEPQVTEFGGMNALYPNLQTDRDLLVSPIARGVELFDQLRSVDSPESLRYRIEMPAGFSLESDGAGGANIAKGGSTLVHVPFPTAVDAQGSSVPTHLDIEGQDLIVQVEHRNRSVAYPILVDPAYELTESWYWYGGSGLSALSDGTWQWGSNVGWIYGSTSCIYACWGSGRGLFASTPNGAFNADQYGQWTYTPPGGTSYVVGADLNPFWRSNHNCSKSQSPEPHDYAGLWNPGGWAVFQADRANDYGNAQLSGSGRVLVAGLGTGPGGSNSCWRDIMLGGASVWITDPDSPTWNGAPGVSPTWTDTTMLPINVSANDPGLGVKTFNLFTQDSSGNPASLIGSANHSCSGLKANACPGSWSTQITNYNPASLPTGINALALRAYDPLPDTHYAGQGVLLKVDHASPIIKTSGELLSPNPIKYHLDVEALDGSSALLSTAQSGMRKLEFFLDGKLEKTWPSANPPPCVNPQQGIDAGSCKFQGLSVDLPRTMSGAHTVKLIAEDSLGHKTTKTISLNLPKDTTAPEVFASGPLWSTSSSWVSAGASSVSVEAKDLETGIAEAAVFVDGEEIVDPAVQNCIYGGCALNQAFPVALFGYEEGLHQVQVVAWDAAGNAAQKSWTVRVDPKRPKLDFTTTPTVPTGWTPQIGSLSIAYAVADKAAAANGSGITKVVAITPFEGGGNWTQTLYSSSCKGTAESPCSQEVAGTRALELFSMLPQGTVQVPLKAYDFAGNVTTQTITLHIDRSAPQVKATGPLAEAAAGTLVTAGSKLDLTVTDRGSGVGTLELLLDGKVEETLTLEEIEADGGKQICSGETCTLTYSFIPDIGQALASGNHTFVVRAKDLAARVGTFSKEVALDTRAPDISLSGALAESAGLELEDEDARLKVAAADPAEAFASGLKWIVIAVDGVQVATRDSCKALPCLSSDGLSYTYREAEWGSGPHEVQILVTDRVGNTAERRVMVNEPITAVAPECPTGPQKTEQAAGVVTPAEASQLFAAAVPPAVAPTEPSASEPAAESPFDPSVAEEGEVSINEQGIDVVGTPTGGGIEDAAAGTFTVGQALCMQPSQKTSAASAPVEVGGDGVLYANSAPETDAIVRPTSFGTTIVEHRRGPASPSSFSWEIKLGPGEELRKLTNGSVVVVKNGVDVDNVEVPTGVPALTPEAIPDVEAQQLRAGANLAEANNAVEGEVTAVIAIPRALLNNGSTVPAQLYISGGEIVSATLPPNVVADTIAMIIEANTSPDPVAMCAHVFSDTPGLYGDGCSEAEDPEAEPTASAEESVGLHELQLQALSAQFRFDFAKSLESDGASASISSPEDPSEQDKEWCYSYWERAAYCAYFNDDRDYAVSKEHKLFNLPDTDSTKANAFRHALWVSAMINSDTPDMAALKFAMHHEKGQRNSPKRRVRYKSAMDGINNFTAWVYAAYRDGNDREACEHWVGKVGPALFIPFNQNPVVWANRNGFEHHNLVYRRKYEGGMRVHLVGQDCG
jgi:hypothetical protein